MLVKKWDRCGGYYDRHHYLSQIANHKANGIVLVDFNDNEDTYYNRKNIDLCPRCLNDFQSWMKKYQEGVSQNAE